MRHRPHISKLRCILVSSFGFRGVASQGVAAARTFAIIGSSSMPPSRRHSHSIHWDAAALEIAKAEWFDALRSGRLALDDLFGIGVLSLIALSEWTSRRQDVIRHAVTTRAVSTTQRETHTGKARGDTPPTRAPQLSLMDSTNAPSAASGIARIRDVLLNVDHTSVRALCEKCGHTTELNWSALALSHSEEKSLRSLARSIRCKKCGARGCGWQMSDNRAAVGNGPLGSSVREDSGITTNGLRS